MMEKCRFSTLQRKIKYFLTVVLLALSSLINTALASVDTMICDWSGLNGNFVKLTSGSFRDVIGPNIEWVREAYDCDKEGRCSYRHYWNIPNRIYTVTATASVTCINVGDATGQIRFSFDTDYIFKPTHYQNFTMRITGAGSLYVSGMENMQVGTIRSWSDGTLEPCKQSCSSVNRGWPNYSKTLTFTFTVRPIKSKVDTGPLPNFDNIDSLGYIWVHASRDDPRAAYSGYHDIPIICGLTNSDMSGCRPTSGSSNSGPSKPPIPECTLTITTPGVVEFQPISSDDLSRNRVRMEDFTLTATKGPAQSQTCIGSTYNLPGTIKTEGGYSISSTFWGINHSSGSPQGIGLKLFDQGKGSYLQFNHTYPSFIANISSMSETKRIRAEIAATTNDLKRIKDGEYSQVLIFEVKMP